MTLHVRLRTLSVCQVSFTPTLVDFCCTCVDAEKQDEDEEERTRDIASTTALSESYCVIDEPKDTLKMTGIKYK